MFNIKTWLQDLVDRSLSKQISGVGFGLFRVAFFSILLLDIVQLTIFREVVFKGNTFAFCSALFIWIPALVCLVIGYSTKIASLINFAAIILTLGQFTDFEYHVDYIYMGISFLAIWSPLENRLSIANYLAKERGRTIPVGYYYLFIFIGLASVYGESCFHKVQSKLWTDGLGFWLPTSTPQFARGNWSIILNIKSLSIALGYITFLFEACFPFAMWIKKLRPFILVIGLGVHLGILLVFPIPYFGLAMISFYLLLIPDHIFSHFKRLPTAMHHPSHLENFRFKALTVYICLMQIFALAATPQLKDVLKSINLDPIVFLSEKSEKMRTLSLGMAPHQMFLDGHFRTPRTDYRVNAEIEKQGQTLTFENILEKSLTGRFWVHWLFRMGYNDIHSEYNREYFTLYLKHWETSLPANIQSKDIKFHIYTRPFAINSLEWKEDALAERAHVSWKKASTVSKIGQEYIFSVEE